MQKYKITIERILPSGDEDRYEKDEVVFSKVINSPVELPSPEFCALCGADK